MCIMPSFRSIENKHAIYRGKDCMKKIARALNEKTNLKKNELINKRAAGII